MRSCDLQDSSLPHLLHKTPTLWDIMWHFMDLAVLLTFPQISQPSIYRVEGHAGNHTSMKLKGVVKAALDS